MASRAELSRKRKRRRDFIRKVVSYAVLCLIALAMVGPFVWMVSTSFKEKDDVMTRETHIIPWRVFHYLKTAEGLRRIRLLSDNGEVARIREIRKDGTVGSLLTVPSKDVVSKGKYYLRVQNYPEAWRVANLGRAYINTIIIAFCITFGKVLTSSLAAFAFARLDFPGRDKLFLAYLGTMMIPETVTLIPLFAIFRKLPEFLNATFHTRYFTAPLYLGDWFVGTPMGVDSYFSLIAPGLFTAYGTFMLRQFFMSIPRDLEDAARIDGCGSLVIWWKIILPLSKPAMITLVIFTFMGSWRMFVWPLVIVDNPKMMPLSVVLKLFQDQYIVDMTLLMAASVIALIPILIVYVGGQKYFTEGILLGAVKG
ncbi:MAG: carbohydrate ABC transporter permease [Deltaproteobacteria bacterium]|nr:carbohydrate ABC transporter permease [Deltaproteobacteria bacterium]